MERTVHDVPESSRYEIREGDRVLGSATYRRRGSQVVFLHTEIDPDEEGSGAGGELVRGALDDLRARRLRAVPRCSFVRGWVDRHPEYAGLVDTPEA